jgi:hypothetical protein
LRCENGHKDTPFRAAWRDSAGISGHLVSIETSAVAREEPGV